MSRIFVLFIVLFSLFFMESCKPCATCTIYPGTTQKICRSSYSSDDSYNQAFHQMEAQGYVCH